MKQTTIILFKTFFLAILFLSWNNVSQAQDKKRNLGKGINSPEYTDASPVISADGKTLYFGREMPKTAYDIYVSELLPNGEWGEAQSIKELNDESSASLQPCSISPDNNTLFVRNKQKGFFFTNRTEKSWGALQEIKLEEQPNEWDNPNFSMSSDGKKVIIQNQTIQKE